MQGIVNSEQGRVNNQYTKINNKELTAASVDAIESTHDKDGQGPVLF